MVDEGRERVDYCSRYQTTAREEIPPQVTRSIAASYVAVSTPQSNQFTACTSSRGQPPRNARPFANSNLALPHVEEYQAMDFSNPYVPLMFPDVETDPHWAPASPYRSPKSEWAPSTEPGALHSTGITQRRLRPVGQFQNAVIKPIMPFLNNLFLRAQRMQHLARNVCVFHMQSIYIARQALHLVIRLNDAVDVNEGPSDEQYDGRNDLEDELIELFEGITEWGRNKGDVFQYEQCNLKIKEQYALLFQDRFYFHDTRDASTDPLYQKYVAYDEKTIRYRQYQRTHVTSSPTAEINCWTEPLEGEGGSEDETGRLVEGTGATVASARSKFVTQVSMTEGALTRGGVREASPDPGHAFQAPYWAPSDRIDSDVLPNVAMSRPARVPRPHGQSPPPGHAFQGSGPGPVPNAQVRLITAYRAGQAPWAPNPRIDPDELPDVEPASPLRSDYEQAMTHAGHADKEYQRDLRSLLQTLPQGDGEVPARPTPEEMQVLFKKVLYHDQARPRGKGSKGGVKHNECKWPACPFKGPLQKCMDHFFCEHVKLKFFKCDQPNCGITFLRKYDLDKHKKKQHALLRPREQSQGDRGVAGPSRQTRSRGAIQPYPHPTQGRSTRGRPGFD